MDPVAVLASLTALGGTLPATYVVGLRPADVGEGIGLSPSRSPRAVPARRSATVRRRGRSTSCGTAAPDDEQGGG